MYRWARCDCGYQVFSRDAADLVHRFRSHAREDHGMEMTEAQVLALAEPLGRAMPPADRALRGTQAPVAASDQQQPRD